MSQVKRTLSWILFLLASSGLLMLAACGSSTPNSKAPAFNTETGAHAEGWLPAQHAAAAKAGEAVCTECHGAELTGGIAGVSCTQCHLGGVASVHPALWSQNTATFHAPYAAANGTAQCANQFCHGTTLAGVAESGPSCTSCHLGGPTAVHPLAWGTAVYSQHPAYVAANSPTACANANCHGTALTGVAGSGPSCTSCHLGGVYSVHPLDWSGSILTKHGLYVVANGTAACANAVCHGPNLQGVTDSGPSCSSCHSFP